jgi:hypothetical protein
MRSIFQTHHRIGNIEKTFIEFAQPTVVGNLD